MKGNSMDSKQTVLATAIRSTTLAAGGLFLTLGILMSCAPQGDSAQNTAGATSDAASAAGALAMANTATADAVSAATDYKPWIESAVPVAREALRDTVIGSGVVQGHQEAVLRARSGGIIQFVNFELGDKLDSGAVLMTLDDGIPSLSLRQLQQQYQAAQSDLRAKEDLFAQGNLSQNQLTQARASLSGLETQLAQIQRELGNTRITTPIAGQIAEKAAGLVTGDQVAPNQVLGRIVDLSRLRVSIALGQRQVFLVRKGQLAEIRIPTTTGSIIAKGVVQAVSAGADQRTGSWTAVVEFANPAPDRIRAGLSAEVRINDNQAATSLVVPDAALVFRDGKYYVFVVDPAAPEGVRLSEVRLLDQIGDRVAVEALDGSSNLEGVRVLISGLTRAQNNL